MDKPIICCFRIKSATLLIGVFDLMCHIMILASLFASISSPHIENYSNNPDTPFRVRSPSEQNSVDQNPSTVINGLYKIKSLVQPLHSSSSSSVNSSLSQSQIQNMKQVYNNDVLLVNTGQTQHLIQNLNSTHLKKFSGDYLWLNSNTVVNRQDRSIAVLVTTCSSLITMMLIYGILYNKPSYLMPYFSIKVFQVVITCITTLGFYSTLPDIKLWLKTQSTLLPFKDAFLTLDRQTLELFVFAVFLITILVKLYVVITVWYCYRHMMLIESFRSQSILHLRSNNGYMGRNSIDNVEDNNSGFKVDDESLMVNGIGLPPKYDDIIKQINEEKIISDRSLNNINNLMPTTSSTIKNSENDDISRKIVKPAEEKSASNSLQEDNKKVEPPSYDLIATNANLRA